MGVARFIASALAVGVVGLAVVACAPDSEEAPVCVGLVIGNRSNSPVVSSELVEGVLPRPLPARSHVLVAGVSGSLAGGIVFSEIVEKVEDSDDETEENGENVWVEALEAVGGVEAKEPQADLLNAMEAAAEELRKTQLAECVIHVYDSGLSTSGLIQFQKNDGALLKESADIEAYIDGLPASKALNGVAVVFETLGETMHPQESLGTDSRARLKDIWERIVERRGGEVRDSETVKIIVEEPGATTSPSTRTLPHVDLVPVSEYTVPPPPLECEDDRTTWPLPGDVLFQPNLAIFKEGAEEMLKEAVDMLSQHPEVSKVEVVGHSASESNQPRFTKVSEDRANAVRDHLVANGANGDKITASGVGDTLPKCEDWDSGAGTQVEGCAETERRIELILHGVDLCVKED